MSTTVLHMAELGSMTGNYNNIEESQWCTDSVKLLVAQSCPTLCDWWTISLPGSSVHGILQATILEWVAYFLLQGIFLTQGSNLGLLHCRQNLYYLIHQGSRLASWKTRQSNMLVGLVDWLLISFPCSATVTDLTSHCRIEIPCVCINSLPCS